MIYDIYIMKIKGWETGQWTECLRHMCENLHLDPQHPCKQTLGTCGSLHIIPVLGRQRQGSPGASWLARGTNQIREVWVQWETLPVSASGLYIRVHPHPHACTSCTHKNTQSPVTSNCTLAIQRPIWVSVRHAVPHSSVNDSKYIKPPGPASLCLSIPLALGLQSCITMTKLKSSCLPSKHSPTEPSLQPNVLIISCIVLRIEPRASYILSKCSTTKPNPRPQVV